MVGQSAVVPLAWSLPNRLPLWEEPVVEKLCTQGVHKLVGWRRMHMVFPASLLQTHLTCCLLNSVVGGFLLWVGNIGTVWFCSGQSGEGGPGVFFCLLLPSFHVFLHTAPMSRVVQQLEPLSVSYFWSSCKNVTPLVCEAQWEGKVFCWARMEGKWSLLDSFLLWSALAVSLLPHSSCPLALFGVLGSTISLLTPLPEWDLQWWGALLPFPLLASPTHPRAALSHLVFLLSSALHPQHHGARWAPGALLLEVSRSSARGWASRAGWAAGVCVPSGWGCVCVCTSLLVLLSGLRLFVYYCNAYVCFAATQSCEEKLLAWDSPGQTLELERARSEPLLTPVVPFVLNSAPCKLAAG